jgi:N,N'-diacetyllegionaminate synthase
VGSFKKSNQPFLPSDHCIVVAEVAQAHDGSLGMAHAFIDAVANAGADAIKFQTHIASAESTRHEPWRIKFSQQDNTRYDYWKRMEFSEEQWHGLRDHAEKSGLQFLSTPFSFEAFEMLSRVSVAAWKVASGETANTPMIDSMIESGLPIILSTGMSSLSEIDTAVKHIKEKGVPLAVLQCTTAYPCPPEKVGLNLISAFRERYDCFVGLSDHSGMIYPGLAAVTLGIEILEVHVTLSREMFGPDVSASITTSELRQLVEGIRFIERMKKNPVDKNEISREFIDLRSAFTKSVVARMDLVVGTVLKEEHLTVKKPGTGMPADRLPELIGRRIKRSVSKDELLSEDQLD